jgi:pilus assembly protein TadC
VRLARIDGLESALLRAPEQLRPLATSLAQAHASGAPIRPSLEAFLDRRRRQRVAEAVARARRLGVVLVAPLALLLLPGFILLMFGPLVADNLVDLSRP